VRLQSRLFSNTDCIPDTESGADAKAMTYNRATDWSVSTKAVTAIGLNSLKTVCGKSAGFWEKMISRIARSGSSPVVEQRYDRLQVSLNTSFGI